MQVLTQAEVYTGAGRAALARAKEGHGKARRALLLQIQNVRIEVAELIASAALSAALETPSQSQAEDYLRLAEREAHKLEREKMGWSLALAGRLRAAIAVRRGRREEALALLKQALERFTEVHMAMYGAAARLRYGQLLGGDAGQDEVHQAEAAMVAQGVRNPHRFAALLAPGFRD